MQYKETHEKNPQIRVNIHYWMFYVRCSMSMNSFVECVNSPSSLRRCIGQTEKSRRSVSRNELRMQIQRLWGPLKECGTFQRPINRTESLADAVCDRQEDTQIAFNDHKGFLRATSGCRHKMLFSTRELKGQFKTHKVNSNIADKWTCKCDI